MAKNEDPVPERLPSIPWYDIEFFNRQKILRDVEPPASVQVMCREAVLYSDTDYNYVQCEVTWTFVRRRVDILKRTLQVRLERTVKPDAEQRSFWQALSDDEKSTCRQTLSNEHKSSDVKTIYFVPVPSGASYSFDADDFPQTYVYRVELVHEADGAAGVMRRVIEFPEWVLTGYYSRWSESRTQRVDEAFVERLSLEREEYNGPEGGVQMEFNLPEIFPNT